MSTTRYVDMELEPAAPSQAIVERIAALEAVDHTELDPLYEVVDPDALDTLVGTTGQSDTALQITFTYHGYDVAVTGDGVVHVDDDVFFER